MTNSITASLADFTERFVREWREQTGHEPVSAELYGIPSPCIVRSEEDKVFWLPISPTANDSLIKVEQAMDISIHPDIHAFYTSQYAGDMAVRFRDTSLSLIQVWNDDDFVRLQENLIGHLFTQRRLKLAPTLFIGSLDSELEVISVCNISGEVILEIFGSKKRQVLAASLNDFLNQLDVIICREDN